MRWWTTHKPRDWWLWNWLPREVRYFGPGHDYYDGDVYHFGFWFFNVGVLV
jgi:hypothetical protein